MAERAGAGFGRALIQRDDAALRDHECHQIGDRVAAFRRRDIADPLRGDVIGLERADDVLLRRRRAAIESVRHRRAARGAGEMREQPGGADGDAGIAGDRRHPQMQARVALLRLGEPGLIEMFEQPHIADRVQRHAAGQHQPAGARGAQQMIDDMDHGVLEHQLGRGGLVEAVPGIGAVMDVLDPQHRIRIPELVRLERFAEYLGERLLVGMIEGVAIPVGHRAVEPDFAVRCRNAERLAAAHNRDCWRGPCRPTRRRPCSGPRWTARSSRPASTRSRCRTRRVN